MDLPDLPNGHAGAVLAMTLVALFLFTRERLALETSSLMVLVALAVGFALVPFEHDGGRFEAVEFFHGFGHEALVAVSALMIIGQGLVRTGALEPVGRLLGRLWAARPQLSLLLTLLVAAVLSAFVNNTPIVVLFLPILANVAHRTRTPVSGVLMPMGFATLVGGTTTTIGTSTNLLVVSIAADLGLERMSMFHFAAPAAIAGTVAILYLWLAAPRLLPERESPLKEHSPRVFVGQLHIEPDSVADGVTLTEAVALTEGALRVRQVMRDEGIVIVPLPDVRLRAGDRLVVEDTPSILTEIERALGATLYGGDTRVDADHPLTASDQQIAEIVIALGSPLDGVSVRHARFLERYRLVALALHRAGRTIATRDRAVADQVLRVGDVLLVQGPAEQIAALRQQGDLLVLDATTELPRSAKAGVAFAVLGLAVVPAALGLLPIAVSGVAGALFMILSGCLSWREATQALNASVILVVVASLALGAALLESGGTQYLTDLFLALSSGASPAWLVAGLIVLMAVMTNVVSNNAAAVIGTPIAIGIAAKLGLAPEPFVLAVLFGANLSYATPMAYKTNLLVMTAGGYTFGDFLRAGVPLIIIMCVTLSLTLAALYGL